jgi:arylsulfatase A-like enzyme
MTDPPTSRARQALRLRRYVARDIVAAVSTEPGPTPLAVVLMAQWFGLVTGLLELAVLLVQNHFYGTATLGTLQLNQHFSWMIPATHLLIFSAAGLVLAPLALIRRRWAVRLTLFVVCALCCFGLLVLIPRLYTAGYVLLACGLAARLVPLIEARARPFRKLVGVSLPLLFGGVVALAGLRYYQVVRAEPRALAQLPAARRGSPNVLLVVLDTVRADRLSLYGYGRDTSPNLIRLARHSVRFERARAAAPWTLPSHASMFTGRLPHELKVFVNRPLDTTYPTLAEFLRDRGYFTAGFVANTRFCNSWYGLGRGFVHYEDYFGSDRVVSFAEAFRSAELGRRILQAACAARNVRAGETHRRKDAAQINRDFLSWLARRGERERPFFAFLNYYDAHDPYITPDGFDRHFGTRPTTDGELALLQSPHVNERLASGKNVTPREIALVQDAYDDCLAYLDEQLGRLFDELDRRGVLANTLVIVTADHGEHLGEHKIYGHGQSLYRPEIQVPLVISAPTGAPAGEIIHQPVSLCDLAATVVERLGLADQCPFPGRSLARFWEHAPGESDPSAEPVRSELIRGGKPSPELRWPPAVRGPMQAIVADGKIYIRNGDGVEELYDIAADPAEVHDLAGSAAGRVVLKRFQALSH